MTVPVNLLPWREQSRQQRKRDFLLLLLATIVLAVCIVVLMAQHQQLAIRDQVASNDLLRSDLARVDASIQEMARLQQRDQDIAGRLVVLQQLQEYRADQARIFGIMTDAVPAEVQLNVMRRRGHSLQVEGIAGTHQAVAQLLRALASEHTVTPLLHRISALASEAGDMRAGDAFLLTLEPAAGSGTPAQASWSE